MQQEDDADQRDDQAFLDQRARERFDGAVDQVRAVVDRFDRHALGRPAEISTTFSLRLWMTSSAFWP